MLLLANIAGFLFGIGCCLLLAIYLDTRKKRKKKLILIVVYTKGPRGWQYANRAFTWCDVPALLLGRIKLRWL